MTPPHDILLQCHGKFSLPEILQSLSEEYEAEPEQLRGDVTECLTHLREEMLVVW